MKRIAPAARSEVGKLWAAVLALATLAAAPLQTPSSPQTPPSQDAAPTSAATAQPPAAATPPPALVLPGRAPPIDSDACRRDCNQTYYFCLAGEGGDDCQSSWSQCLAACDAPLLRSPVDSGP
ncbi:MAG: hypothetical protein ACRED9_08170 [Caulobacteraceae bacterium]